LSKDAEINISVLKEKEAAASYNIAVFYEKQEAYKAAKIYYENVISNYSDTAWAAKALERLQLMETKKE
jgi:outer membrane protein assembly factor BamD (BamD/ComL family)